MTSAKLRKVQDKINLFLTYVQKFDFFFRKKNGSLRKPVISEDKAGCACTTARKYFMPQL